MSFLEKYHVVSMLGAGETNSFRAQEISTGRHVVVHQLVSGQPSPQQPDLMSMIYTYLPGKELRALNTSWIAGRRKTVSLL